MIISIDQSLTSSGISVISNDGKILYTGLVKTTPKTHPSWYKRMQFILHSIIDIINSYYDSDKDKLSIVLENYAFNASLKAFPLGELGGCIKYELYRRYTIEAVQLYPQHHKMWSARKGNAKKPQVIKMLKKRFNIETDSTDIADSLSMGLMFWNLLQYEKGIKYDGYDRGLFIRVRKTLDGIRLTTKKKRKRKSTASTKIGSDRDPFSLK